MPVGAAAVDPDEALRADIRAALEEGGARLCGGQAPVSEVFAPQARCLCHGARYAIDGGHPALALKNHPLYATFFLEDKPHGSKQAFVFITTPIYYVNADPHWARLIPPSSPMFRLAIAAPLALTLSFLTGMDETARRSPRPQPKHMT